MSLCSGLLVAALWRPANLALFAIWSVDLALLAARPISLALPLWLGLANLALLAVRPIHLALPLSRSLANLALRAIGPIGLALLTTRLISTALPSLRSLASLANLQNLALRPLRCNLARRVGASIAIV